MRDNARREALRQIELFRALGAEAIETIAARATTRRAARGETVLRRGDPGDTLLVILQGKLRIGAASADGRDAALGVLGPGQTVGEMALLDGEPRSADVVALEETVLLALDRAAFLDTLRRTPDLALAILGVLSRRLRAANAALADIATLDLETRLRRTLGRLAREFGAPAGTRTRLGLKLSQKDLAALVGASREQVNRELRRLEEAGALAREDGYLVLSFSPDDPA